MRIGVFGGTFDPIHYGHLVLAEQCRDQCQLDEVWFVPAANPPHKLDVPISPAEARCEMTEFAISGNPHFRLSRIELGRSGPSFTFMTLEQLSSEDPTRQLFLLIGADSLSDLPTWREPGRILERATIVAVNRGEDLLPDRASIESRLEQFPDFRLVYANMPAMGISASDIRQRVARGQSIRYLVPRSVEIYIQQHRLYAPH